MCNSPRQERLWLRRSRRPDEEFAFRCIEFEMSVRHASGGVKGVRHLSLEVDTG